MVLPGVTGNALMEEPSSGDIIYSEGYPGWPKQREEQKSTADEDICYLGKAAFLNRYSRLRDSGGQGLGIVRSAAGIGGDRTSQVVVIGFMGRHRAVGIDGIGSGDG